MATPREALRIGMLRYPGHVASHDGASGTTVRKWLGRSLAAGRDGLSDRPSRPLLSPRSISSAKALTSVELRRKRMTQARIARYLKVPKLTVSRVLARAGLARLGDLDPVEPVQR
jgi:hypothetical protein